MNRPLTPARERGLFSGSLALSVGLHAALAVLVLLLAGGRPPAPPSVLTVSLVAPPAARPGPGGSPGSAGVPGSQAGSPQKPADAPAATLAQPAPPPAKPKPRKAKKRATPPVPRPQPQPQQALTPPPRVVPEPSPPAPPTPPAPVPPRATASSSTPTPARGWSGGEPSGTAAAGRAAAGPGSGTGTTSSAVLGYGQRGPGGGGHPAAAQSTYLKLIRARILAQRKYPYMARQRRQEGVVRLRFTLSAAGALSQGVQVVQPSGHNLLDDQARQCVLAAAPFPPFPRGLPRERLAIELPIIYKISELER